MNNVQTLRKELEKQPIFTMKDIKLILPKSNYGYIRLLIHNMRKKNEIFRISRGAYTFHEEMIVVGFAYSPFYYGLQQALSIHGLWEQEVNPVVITPKMIRNGNRKFSDNNYFLRRISRKMFFGFEAMNYSGFWVPVSDVEKTLIDMVYYRQHISKGLKEEFNLRVDKKKLQAHLKRVPKKYWKRIGEIADISIG